METLNDFGAVQHFGVDTFTTGIYRTWLGMREPAAAAQLAAILMLFIAAVFVLERWSRGRRGYAHSSTRYRPLPRYHMTGLRAGIDIGRASRKGRVSHYVVITVGAVALKKK